MRGDPGSEPRFKEADRTAAAAGFSLEVSKTAMGLEAVHTLRFHDPDDGRITEALAPGELHTGHHDCCCIPYFPCASSSSSGRGSAAWDKCCAN